MTDQKLSIGATVRESYSFLGANFFPATGLIIQYCLLYFAIVLPIRVLPMDWEPVAFLLLTLAGVVGLPPLAITVHRQILLGEPISLRTYFASFTLLRYGRFFLYGLALLAIQGIGTGVLTAADASLVEPNTLNVLLSLLVSLALFAFVFGFFLTFPAIAVDEFKSLMASHKMMRGSVWRTFFAMVLAVLPLQLAGFILGMAALTAPGWVASILNLAIAGYSAIVGVAALSFSYAYAKQRTSKT